MNKIFKFLTLTVLILAFFLIYSSRVLAQSDTGDSTSYSCVTTIVNSNDYLAWYNTHCITPTPSLSPTETPAPTETLTPTPTIDPCANNGCPSNPGGGSDGRNDGLGCASHDCSNQGGGTTQAVLGLSSTNSESNTYITLAQLMAALGLAAIGYKFLKKNA